jgi:uncharacterized SAM-binding protein YcdF (DUF218 family)
LPAVGEWLDVGTQPPSTEYVMVLGGDPETRASVAASLVQAGQARRVLVPVPPGFSTRQEDPLCRALLRRGVPDARIILLNRRVASTYDEAVALGDFLASHPAAGVSVVTNHYHTRRARWIFTQVLRPQAKNIFFVSAPDKRFELRRWWQIPCGADKVLLEYRKLAFYLLSYGPGRQAATALAIWQPQPR